MRYKENRSSSRYCTFYLVCACEQYVFNENRSCSGLCTFYLVHVNNLWRIAVYNQLASKFSQLRGLNSFQHFDALWSNPWWTSVNVMWILKFWANDQFLKYEKDIKQVFKTFVNEPGLHKSLDVPSSWLNPGSYSPSAHVMIFWTVIIREVRLTVTYCEGLTTSLNATK